VSPETRSRIGGRFAFGWILYLLGAPMAIFSHVVFLDGRTNPLGTTVVSSIFGYAVMGLVWLALNVTFLRNRDRVPLALATVLALAAVSGAVRAGASVGLSTLLGGSVPLGNVTARVASGALVAVAVVPIATYVIASIAYYRTERARLLSERVMARASALEFERAGQALQELATSVANEHISKAITPALEALATNEERPEEMAARLRRTSQEDIRQTAHAMWGSQSEYVPLWSTRQWLRLARPSHIVVMPTAAIWLASMSLLTWTRAGLLWGTLAIALSTGAVVVGLCLAKYAGTHLCRGAWLAAIVLFVMTLTVGSFIVGLVPNIGLERMLLDLPVAIIWASGLAATITVANAAVFHADDVIEQLTRDLDHVQLEAAAAEQLTVQIQREVAQLLHSQVQGRVHGVITLLEQSPDLDRNWVKEQLQDLQVQPLDRNVSEDLNTQMLRLARSWDGMMHVEVVCDVDRLKPEQCRQVMQVISEALTNAHRHGRAQHVTMRVTTLAGATQVEVDDDGLGILTIDDNPSGMGTQVFSHAAPGNWRLERLTSGGTRLVASI